MLTHPTTDRLREPPSSSPTSPARDTHCYPAGSIGMPGWLRSEQVAGFNRNRWLQSSECASNVLAASIKTCTGVP